MPPLSRPPRRPARSVDEAVRRAILQAAANAGLPPKRIVAAYIRGDHFGSLSDALEAVEEAWVLEPNAVPMRMMALAEERVGPSPQDALDHDGSMRQARVGVHFTNHVDELALYALPDVEFLTAVERAGALQARVPVLAAEILQGRGLPYRWAGNGFEWVGEAIAETLALRPTLAALHDPRLVGARVEFDDALLKLRAGDPKSLEDAADEAAKAVEGTLGVLFELTPGADLDGKRPGVENHVEILISVGVLERWMKELVVAASRPRNQKVAHSSGGEPRRWTLTEAQAVVAAAMAAIPLLQSLLP